jgi:subtilisin family serine protease
LKDLKAFAILLLLLCQSPQGWALADQDFYLVTYKMPQSFNERKLLTQSHEVKNLISKVIHQLEQTLFGSSSQKILETFWLAQSSLVQLNPTEFKQLSRSNHVARISKIRKNFKITDNSRDYRPLTKNYGLKLIGMPEVRGRYWGLDGRGVKVGIIDTGISLQHPEFKNRIAATRDFTGTIESAEDDHGHGSHVAGTIGGNNLGSHEIGVAPGVEFVIAKAFNSRGNSEETELLRALQWMADPDGDPTTQDAPKVINNSWNNDGNFSNIDPHSEPFCIATENLLRMGILAVFAAGNDGSASSSIKLPAACPSAFSVGATDAADKIASSSSRGPVKWKSITLVKPEVSAPGVDIFSSDKGSSYRTRSGTSMAAPHVVGSLALLFQYFPIISAEEVTKKLVMGCVDLGTPGQDNIYGAGRINVYRSISE